MCDLTQYVKEYSEREVNVCFRRLVNYRASENVDRNMSGIKVIRRLFRLHIMECKTKTGWSFASAMRDPIAREKYEQLAKKYNRPGSVYGAFELWNGCINVFRPASAKWLYQTYGAKVGVLDFSAGWGSRLLASLSMGVPYIGIDTNRELIEPYRQLTTHYNPHGAHVDMIWDKAESVDFSQMRYDVCMTSPPYYTLERYQHMPDYQSKQDFTDTFLIPVVSKAFRYLQPGGYMILNMPVEMYEAVKNVLPPLHTTHHYPKAGRHSAMKNGSKRALAYEVIYVWTKH